MSSRTVGNMGTWMLIAGALLVAAALPGALCFVNIPTHGIGSGKSIRVRCPAHGQGLVAGSSLLGHLTTRTRNNPGSVVLRSTVGEEEEGGEVEGQGVEGSPPAWATDDSDEPLNRKERRRLNKKMRGRERNRVQGPDGETSMSRNKALSQNLLVDPGIIDRMISALDDQSPAGRCVLELGPGLGALTVPLSEDYPEMTAVELDPQACKELKTTLPKLKLVEGSLLDFDFEAHSKAVGGRLSVISNLPFGITSSALFHMLDASTSIRRAVLLMQQEAADRILSDPSRRKYGTQAIEFALRGLRVQQICAVPSIAFDPPPKNTKCAVLLVDFQDELPLGEVEMKILRTAMQAGFEDRALPLASTLPKRAALRALVPGLQEYCEGGANWLQKKPTDLAPGKWVHAARSMANYAGVGDAGGAMTDGDDDE